MPRRCSPGPGSRPRVSRPQARSPPRAERFTGRSRARGPTGRGRSWCSRRTTPPDATPSTPRSGTGRGGTTARERPWGREGVRPRRRRRALGLPGLRRRVRAEERRAPRRGGREHGRDGEVLGPRGQRLEREHAPPERGQQRRGSLQHLRLGPPRAHARHQPHRVPRRRERLRPEGLGRGRGHDLGRRHAHVGLEVLAELPDFERAKLPGDRGDRPEVHPGGGERGRSGRGVGQPAEGLLEPVARGGRLVDAGHGRKHGQRRHRALAAPRRRPRQRRHGPRDRGRGRLDRPPHDRPLRWRHEDLGGRFAVPHPGHFRRPAPQPPVRPRLGSDREHPRSPARLRRRRGALVRVLGGRRGRVRQLVAGR